MNSLLIIRNIFRGIGLVSLIFRLFFVKQICYLLNVFSYIMLAIGLAGIIIMEIIIYIRKKRSWPMKKYFYKFASNIIYILFLIALFFVVVIREHVKSELGVMIINYGFWYCFGVLSGFIYAIFIYKSWLKKH